MKGICILKTCIYQLLSTKGVTHIIWSHPSVDTAIGNAPLLGLQVQAQLKEKEDRIVELEQSIRSQEE